MSEAQAAVQDEAVSLNDSRVHISTYERYKGRKGITDRLGIVSTALLQAHTYFYEAPNQKTLFRAPKDPNTLAFVKSVLGEPTQRFGVLLFHYTTDENGELIDDTKLRGKLKIWVISESRYQELGQLDKQWKLLDEGFDKPQYDFTAKCTEEQYQRMTFTPCPNAFWKRKQQWYDYVKTEEKKAKERLRWALGKQLKDPEIMALLGNRSGASPTTAGDAVGDIDLSDIVGEA